MKLTPLWVKICLAMLVLAPLVGGGWLYTNLDRHAHQEVGRALTSIVHLKANHVAAWREDLLRQGESISRCCDVSDLLLAPNSVPPTELVEKFRRILIGRDYRNVLFLSPDGQPYFSLDSEWSGRLPDAVALGDISSTVLTDLYKDSDTGSIWISLIVPVFSQDDATKRIGAIQFVIDPKRFLYPLIETWPTPSQTAETLLVRRDNKGVLFMSQPRHRKGPALSLHASPSEGAVSALMAEQPHEGAVSGLDYRGVKVLSVIEPIPNSPWLLIAKIDEKEAFAEWHFEALLILATIGCSIIVLVFATLLLWLRNEKLHLLSLYHSQEAHRTSESRYRELFEHMDSGVAVYQVRDDGNEFILLDINKSGERIAKQNRDSMIGKSLYELRPELADSELTEVFRRVWTTGQPECQPATQYTVNDVSRWYENCVYKLPSGDIVTIFDDVSEKKDADKERQKLELQLMHSQKMESVGRLAGGVAHDFNNMLNVILGRAELIINDLPDVDPMRTDIDEIISAARRSADLTRQLLAFARKQPAAPQNLDINEVVTDILNLLGRLIGENIELQWQPARSLDAVCVDPSQIEQVLTNLVVNASDAIEHERGKIIIETEAVEFEQIYHTRHADIAPGRYVTLSVTDNGTGIREEHLASVFEPFFTTKELGKGTGLGLATVYGIISQNGGAIEVFSVAGQGTTFRVYLPASNEQAKATVVGKLRTSEIRGHETILLVEDEPVILHVVQTMLTRLGYTVLSATRARDAIRLAEKHLRDIDLLITDVVMPDMNGRDLADHLVKICPQLLVLYVSGHTSDVIAEHGIVDSGVSFLSKPFTSELLGRKVRELLAVANKSMAL